LPALAAYEALIIIKNILDVKEAEKKKELEKLERDGGISNRKAVTIVEEQPQPEPEIILSPQKTTAGAKKGNVVQQVPNEMTEHQKQRQAEKEEIQKYGVSLLLIKRIAHVDMAKLLQRRKKGGFYGSRRETQAHKPSCSIGYIGLHTSRGFQGEEAFRGQRDNQLGPEAKKAQAGG